MKRSERNEVPHGDGRIVVDVPPVTSRNRPPVLETAARCAGTSVRGRIGSIPDRHWRDLSTVGGGQKRVRLKPAVSTVGGG